MPIQTVSQAFSNEGVGGFTYRNFIHNGNFIVDQRNTSSTPITSGSYSFGADRFGLAHSSNGAFSLQRVADAPSGFKYSNRVTVTTADSSLSASQRMTFNYAGEMLDFQRLNWGTANAKAVTLSFWIKSSVTGTYSFTIRTANAGTSYTAAYTINNANTWEQKIITIPGPTIGTWTGADNSEFAYFVWSLGIGSDFETGTTGSWTSVSNGQGRTSHVSLLSTLNATWQITGVQLEEGSVATPFEHRPYATELALCQRYLPGYVYSSASGSEMIGWARGGSSSTIGSTQIVFPVTARVPPTGISVTGSSWAVSGLAFTTIAFGSASTNVGQLDLSGGSGMTTLAMYTFTSSAVGSRILFTGCEI